MNKTEFEGLRDMPDKVIREDISFARRQALRPLLVADGIPIENPHGVELRMNLTPRDGLEDGERLRRRNRPTWPESNAARSPRTRASFASSTGSPSVLAVPARSFRFSWPHVTIRVRMS